MKKSIIILSLLAISSSLSFGQMHIDSLYENKEEFLILRKVAEFDSLSQENLVTKVKNWAGIKFNNMKEVLVSETKEQLVFVYISQSFFFKTMGQTTTGNWYVRLVVDVKDNKLRISLFDDGNTATHNSAARQAKLSAYFAKNGIATKVYNDGLVNVKLSCVNMVTELIGSITKKSNSDW